MSEHFVHFDILDSIYPSSRNVASAVGYVAFHVKKNKDIYNEVTFWDSDNLPPPPPLLSFSLLSQSIIINKMFNKFKWNVM